VIYLAQLTVIMNFQFIR